jgi:hypothetical protein
MAYCSLNFIKEKLSSLHRSRYNKYHWWRRFEYRNELNEKASLRDRIAHGDFEVSDYLYQSELEEYLLEEKVNECKTADDIHEARKLFNERKRRLTEDYEKDELKLMKNLKSQLSKQFHISVENISGIMEEFDGSTLELYDHLQDLNNQRVITALKK